MIPRQTLLISMEMTQDAHHFVPPPTRIAQPPDQFQSNPNTDAHHQYSNAGGHYNGMTPNGHYQPQNCHQHQQHVNQSALF